MRTSAALLALAILGPIQRAQAFQKGVDTRASASASTRARNDMWALLCPRAGSELLDEGRTAKEIAKLGPDVLRALVGLFVGDVVEPELGYEVEPRARDAREGILIATLRLYPRAEVAREVDLAARASRDLGRQLAVVRLWSGIGGAEALDRVIAIASGLEPEHWDGALTQASFIEGLAKMVRGQARLSDVLTNKLHRAKPVVARIFLRALREAGAASVASELVADFGRDADLDLCLAETLEAFGEAAAGMLTDSALSELRSHLDSRDPRLASAIAVALGRLGDERGAGRLLRLLDDSDLMLRNAALSALRTLSGREFPASRPEWSAWFDEEDAWKAERLPELERMVLDAKPEVLSGALAEMAAHRLFRHRVAMDLVPLLSNPNPEIVRLVCGVLAYLGSCTALPALEEAARSGEAQIRSAAVLALQVLERKPSDAVAPAEPSRP